MKVLVDTSVWSLAFRRRAPAHAFVDELRRLIINGRAALVGPVRQEVLSGIRDFTAFERLRDRLGAFPDEPLTTADYERAAPFRAVCAELGVDPALLAHQYALDMEGVDTVVLGVKNRHELAQCLDAEARGSLAPELRARIDGLGLAVA